MDQEKFISQLRPIYRKIGDIVALLIRMNNQFADNLLSTVSDDRKEEFMELLSQMKIAENAVLRIALEQDPTSLISRDFLAPQRLISNDLVAFAEQLEGFVPDIRNAPEVLYATTYHLCYSALCFMEAQQIIVHLFTTPFTNGFEIRDCLTQASFYIRRADYNHLSEVQDNFWHLEASLGPALNIDVFADRDTAKPFEVAIRQARSKASALQTQIAEIRIKIQH